MTPQQPDSAGRFVKKSVVRPAIEVDCSTWEDQTTEATGRFVKPSLVRRAVPVDCCVWPEISTGQAEITKPDDPAKTGFSQGGSDRHLVGESVNGVFVIHSSHRQLDEVEGEQLAEMVREGGANSVLLNLTGVDFVSAWFIASLVRVHRQIQSVGGKFAVCNLGRQAQEVFSLLNLEQMFSSHNRQQKASQTE